ncbi:peptidase T [Halobacillus halophilus]|uniref:Peptidase T n=1 Tax=Halobacillus halophilus (strain ATCC 35676 / DSM 2266 / JCM 20832 / KCTC 3685 / LMG 17431 / NBRC 102448 / NCIMB 2269) TaxID=866895 RepID=I0JSG4_HALH3|nr:peptidase T [Halobacillus halophilus]ASF41023.1 peptidase T [Halobacillus halophilus]CCG47086.1 peptidase T [Halobacillus halophilus DSM 2266]
MKDEILKRFCSYVKVNTQSDENSAETPSTEGQWTLARQLAQELEEIGMSEVSIDENAYVMATLPANTEKDVPVIGFLAHIDTAVDFTGENVKPQVVESYDGGDISLNEEVNLSPLDFPELSRYKGQTLITTDGTTLLGADNKAGITEIMTALHYLIRHPEIKHGKIRVAFTPDEEIGRGPHKFNIDRFAASYAYTVDGGPLGELQFESFNAATANIDFYGNSVHPGTAKDKMINAVKLAIEFQENLPKQEAPEYTENYEGFYHLNSFHGDVEHAALTYLVRDHDQDLFKKKKDSLDHLVEEMKDKYGSERISIDMSDQYYNMGDKITPVKQIVDTASEAMDNLGIKPLIKPIRGGTDGSQLSYMGLPTPNIFTGGQNFHGKYEYISLDHMEKAVNVIVEIARLFEEKS